MRTEENLEKCLAIYKKNNRSRYITLPEMRKFLRDEFCIFPHFLVFQVFQYFIRCLNAFVTNHPMFTSDKMVYLICCFPTHKTVFLSSHIPSPLIAGQQKRRPLLVHL
jgi:hypothetical protein